MDKMAAGTYGRIDKANENQIEEKEIQPRHYDDPRADANIDGFWYAKEEVEQVQRQNARAAAAYEKKRREMWLETEQGKLCMAFYQAFQAYKKYLEQHLQCAARRGRGPAGL